MARNRATVQTTFGMPMPVPPGFDPGAMMRLSSDLMAQAGRMWLDLWFANLDRASSAFWQDVRRQGRTR